MSGARVNRDGIRSKAESKNNHPAQDNNNNNNKIPFDPLARSNVDKQHLLVLEGVIFNRVLEPLSRSFLRRERKISGNGWRALLDYEAGNNCGR